MQAPAQQGFVPRPIFFQDHPEFRPNLTPVDIFAQGAFQGAYWRPINSKVTGRLHQNEWTQIPCLVEMVVRNPASRQLLDNPAPNSKLNKYGVKAGSSLEEWESKGWIKAKDPYGWVQWYCRFYYGVRDEAEDARQIDRWLKFAGPKGRFRVNLINKILKAGTHADDGRISPVIRQGLHHWAYCLVPEDLVS